MKGVNEKEDETYSQEGMLLFQLMLRELFMPQRLLGYIENSIKNLTEAYRTSKISFDDMMLIGDVISSTIDLEAYLGYNNLKKYPPTNIYPKIEELETHTYIALLNETLIEDLAKYTFILNHKENARKHVKPIEREAKEFQEKVKDLIEWGYLTDDNKAMPMELKDKIRMVNDDVLYALSDLKSAIENELENMKKFYKIEISEKELSEIRYTPKERRKLIKKHFENVHSFLSYEDLGNEDTGT